MRSKFFKFLIPMILVVHMNSFSISADTKNNFDNKSNIQFQTMTAYGIVLAIIFFNFYEAPVIKIKKSNDEKESEEFRSFDPKLTIQENIALELQKSRQIFLETHVIPQYEYPVITTSQHNEILKQQEALFTMKKTMIYKGLMEGFAISLCGCLDVANIIARNEFIISGNGLITNSYSSQATLIQGNFILDSSVLYGKTFIDQKDSSIFFISCFIDSLSITKQDVVVVILDTVVTGTITFNYPGTIVMNKNSYISGVISNAEILMID